MQVTAIPKMAAENTSLVATNSSGDQVVVPVPQGSEVFVVVTGVHYNRASLPIASARKVY